MNSYFPAMPRRPSAHRLSSLGGLETALEAMERKPGNEIEKDDVDNLICASPEREDGMFSTEVVDEQARKQEMINAMAQRRRLRGREGRRLAMLDGHVACGNAQQFVEEAERQQEDVPVAFRERVQKAAAVENAGQRVSTEPQALTDIASARPAALSNATAFEFAQPRRHSMFYPSPEHRARSRSASVSASPGSSPACSPRPSAEWLKAYNSVIGKAHFVEKRSSFGKHGVLHARVQKKICGRRGI